MILWSLLLVVRAFSRCRNSLYFLQMIYDSKIFLVSTIATMSWNLKDAEIGWNQVSATCRVVWIELFCLKTSFLNYDYLQLDSTGRSKHLSKKPISSALLLWKALNSQKKINLYLDLIRNMSRKRYKQSESVTFWSSFSAGKIVLWLLQIETVTNHPLPVSR